MNKLPPEVASTPLRLVPCRGWVAGVSRTRSAIPTGTLAPDRSNHAGQVSPDKNKFPGPPGLGLSIRPTNSSRKTKQTVAHINHPNQPLYSLCTRIRLSPVL